MKVIRFVRVSKDEQAFLTKLPDLSGSAVKVYIAIARTTAYRHREELPLSIRHLCNKTGLQWPTVQRAVEELQEARLIDKTYQENSKEKMRTYSSYTF